MDRISHCQFCGKELIYTGRGHIPTCAKLLTALAILVRQMQPSLSLNAKVRNCGA